MLSAAETSLGCGCGSRGKRVGRIIGIDAARQCLSALALAALREAHSDGHESLSSI